MLTDPDDSFSTDLSLDCCSFSLANFSDEHLLNMLWIMLCPKKEISIELHVRYINRLKNYF